jgi:hypothetical protein
LTMLRISASRRTRVYMRSAVRVREC